MNSGVAVKAWPKSESGCPVRHPRLSINQCTLCLVVNPFFKDSKVGALLSRASCKRICMGGVRFSFRGWVKGRPSPHVCVSTSPMARKHIVGPQVPFKLWGCPPGNLGNLCSITLPDATDKSAFIFCARKVVKSILSTSWDYFIPGRPF